MKFKVSKDALGVPFVEAGLTACGDVIYTGDTGDTGYELRSERWK